MSAGRCGATVGRGGPKASEVALDAKFVATVAKAGKVVRRAGSAAKRPLEVGYVANSACLAHGLWKSDHLQRAQHDSFLAGF